MKFDQETHTYYDDNGAVIPSVSEIIRNWLGNKYETVNAEVLKKAQDKGNKVHKEIEDYLLQNVEPKKPSYEFSEFKRILEDNKELGFTVKATHSEQIIVGATDYGSYAGTYDLFNSVDGILYDIKTNYNLDEEYVTIQLSLYAMALRQQDVKITKAYVIHIPSKKSPEKPQIRWIKLMSDSECEEIVRAYFAGEHKPQLELQTCDLPMAQKLETSIQAIERIELEIKEVKEKILQEMETRGINQIKVGNITISYVAPTTRESLDSKKIKLELPKIYEKYKKTSNVKGSVRITVKGE